MDLSLFAPVDPAPTSACRGRCCLYVGRVSYEKNLEAFLEPGPAGSKVVYGVGPLVERLQRAHPAVHWRGVVPRAANWPQIYSAADVFVFPEPERNLRPGDARSDGLRHAGGSLPGGRAARCASAARDGGVLDDDLRDAALEALEPAARRRP